MTPTPPLLGSGELIAWRLDRKAHAATWDSGEGAYRGGGRWNPKGARAVYCSLDPSTAILEVAVHVGFNVLDSVPHVLTSLKVDASAVHVVSPADVPNPNWLRPGAVSAGQQAFGMDLMRKHALVLIPSVITNHSWNLIFEPTIASGRYAMRHQEPFALDTRLASAT